MRVLIAVTHLLGVGHLARAAVLADVAGERGSEIVDVASKRGAVLAGVASERAGELAAKATTQSAKLAEVTTERDGEERGKGQAAGERGGLLDDAEGLQAHAQAAEMRLKP